MKKNEELSESQETRELIGELQIIQTDNLGYKKVLEETASKLSSLQFENLNLKAEIKYLEKEIRDLEVFGPNFY